VRKIDTKGVITTIAGTGTPGFSGDGAAASAAQLNLPYGLALDLSGNLYVADLGNQRVRRISPTGTITTVAGTGVKGSTGDGAAATAAQLSTPRNLAVDSQGNLYISEFDGHRVRRVTAGGMISTFAGTGKAGYSGDGSPSGSAQLNFPAGLATDTAGALYIADSQNNRIRKILPGGLISTVAGGGSMAVPHAVAVDAQGIIYVADGGTVVYSLQQSGLRSSFAGTSARDFTGDGGPAPKAALLGVLELISDQVGGIYLADSIRIRKVDMLGKIQTIAGDGYVHAVGDGAAATDAILHQPASVVLDYFGNLFIADSGTERIREVLSSGKIQTLAGNGIAGAGSSQLSNPSGVTGDAKGNLYVADTGNHRIVSVNSSGSIATVLGVGVPGSGPDHIAPLLTLLQSPRAVCLDRNGVLYVADTGNHRFFRMAPAGLPERVAGTGTAGFSGDSGQATLAKLNQPSACALDSFGSLYIADTGNHRIRKIGASGIIATVAGNDQGFSGDEGPATTAQLNSPQGIAVDDSGNIYIADTGNNRIRLVTPDGNIHTIGGSPDDTFTPTLASPAGLFLDGSGNVYFADSGNDRVRRLVPQTQAPPAPLSTATFTTVNAASLQSGTVAPGEVIVLSSSAPLGPDTGVGGSLDSGQLPTQLGEAEVHFDQVAAPLLYVQASQINVQVPYDVLGKTTHVDVIYQGLPVGSFDAPVAPASPGLYPVALNEEGMPNSAKTPAFAGSVVTVFCTGEGLTDGANAAGVPGQSPYPHPKSPVKAAVGNEPATVIDAFGAPGVVGMSQITIRIPSDASSGQTSLQVSVGGATAPSLPLWVK